MTSIAERLVEELAARGVQVVFGLPGVHTVELYRGLAASQIRHVNARHEQGAGFMADGYARASQCSADGTKGRPGVLFVITGPGLTNALTAVAQARADSSPILVISAENPVASLGLGLGGEAEPGWAVGAGVVHDSGSDIRRTFLLFSLAGAGAAAPLGGSSSSSKDLNRLPGSLELRGA